jgi:bacillithiol system protein YtxJ
MAANFINLDSQEKLEKLFERSHTEPVLLFKHSNSCGISSGVFDIVSDVNAEINLVVVQTDRHISNRISEITGIRHQSPQAIILKSGSPVYSASHYDITVDDIEDGLQN